MGKSYRDAGVDIDTADDSINRIKSLIKSTFSKQVLSDIGLFGGFFEFPEKSYHNPVLVSSVDGVGTKLKVAVLADKHDTIGYDLVNHCVNDIAVSGAIPLFFMDYFAMGKLHPKVFEAVVSGCVRACRENACALIGGETAEMPGMYQEGDYDLAGMIVGVVEKNKIINGSNIVPGDIVIGLASTGLHTNGYSLARAVLLEKYRIDSYVPELGKTLAEELLEVHRSYLHIIQKAINVLDLHGFAHVTGGGIVGNTKRIIPKNATLHIDWGVWEVPPIFRLIQQLGNVDDEEMRRVFNLGVGLTIIVPKKNIDAAMELLQQEGERPIIIGEIKSVE